jgi:hypothetical protein
MIRKQWSDIDKLINQFYLDSEQDGQAIRPHAVLLTEEQFEDLQMTKHFQSVESPVMTWKRRMHNYCIFND